VSGPPIFDFVEPESTRRLMVTFKYRKSTCTAQGGCRGDRFRLILLFQGVKSGTISQFAAPRALARQLSCLFILIALGCSHALSAEIRGTAHVVDGDTITLDGTKIRLNAIDAPETDRSGRPLASCRSCDVDLQKWRVHEGLALFLHRLRAALRWRRSGGTPCKGGPVGRRLHRTMGLATPIGHNGDQGCGCSPHRRAGHAARRFGFDERA
jgi:hypothetical protein